MPAIASTSQVVLLKKSDSDIPGHRKRFWYSAIAPEIAALGHHWKHARQHSQ
jgi:hypothetical protein